MHYLDSDYDHTMHNDALIHLWQFSVIKETKYYSVSISIDLYVWVNVTSCTYSACFICTYCGL